MLGNKFSSLIVYFCYGFVSIFLSLVTLQCSAKGCTIKCVQKYKYKDFTENKHPFVMEKNGCDKIVMSKNN